MCDGDGNLLVDLLVGDGDGDRLLVLCGGDCDLLVDLLVVDGLSVTCLGLLF